MMSNIKIAIIGFGNVGRSLAKLIAFKGRDIERKFKVKLSVVAIADSKGAVVKEDGLTPYELLKLCELPRSYISTYKPYGVPEARVKEIYSRIIPDIHIEVTPSNYESGEPGLSNILYAINNGVNIVTANKAPLVLKYSYIMQYAKQKGVQVRFKATVMAGTPLIDLLRSLKGYDIESIEGIINGTTNYILTEMHEDLIPYSDALKKAQALGIAEANPDLDVKGWDAAAKLVIISNVIGEPLSLNDVERDDLSKLDLREVFKAIKEGMVLKFIAKYNVKEKKASVKITKIPRDDILSNIKGTMNAVRIKTDINNIVLIGKGAGRMETAHALMDDILSIAEVISHGP